MDGHSGSSPPEHAIPQVHEMGHAYPPIGTATGILQEPSELEAIELERTVSRHFARVEAASNPHHGPARQKLSNFWKRHVSMAVPHADCRDHLGEPSINHASFAVWCPGTDCD